MKGFLNVENCEGTTIYTAKNRIRLGDPEGTTIYSDFSASNIITIAWGGEMVEGTNVIVKVPGSAAGKFQLVGHDGWWLSRKASNGDMYMTQKDDPVTGINEVRSQMDDVRGEYYNLSGQRVEKMGRGIYIVNGKKIIIK